MTSAATDPRALAREILSERRFAPSKVPRPFGSFFDWLGRKLSPVTRWIGRVIESIAHHVPGGRATVWTVLAIIVTAVVAVVTYRVVQRRSRAVVSQQGAAALYRRADPDALEAEADAAERNGDFATAIRLRFVAGLIRLDRAETIYLEDSTTPRAVARKLHSNTFDALTDTFERVVYGERPPTTSEVERSRVGWRSLVGDGVPTP
jgi:hypothetical protein